MSSSFFGVGHARDLAVITMCACLKTAQKALSSFPCLPRMSKNLSLVLVKSNTPKEMKTKHEKVKRVLGLVSTVVEKCLRLAVMIKSILEIFS